MISLSTHVIFQWHWCGKFPFLRRSNMNIFLFHISIKALNFVILIDGNWTNLCCKCVDTIYLKIDSFAGAILSYFKVVVYLSTLVVAGFSSWEYSVSVDSNSSSYITRDNLLCFLISFLYRFLNSPSLSVFLFKIELCLRFPHFLWCCTSLWWSWLFWKCWTINNIGW